MLFILKILILFVIKLHLLIDYLPTKLRTKFIFVFFKVVFFFFCPFCCIIMYLKCITFYTKCNERVVIIFFILLLPCFFFFFFIYEKSFILIFCICDSSCTNGPENVHRCHNSWTRCIFNWFFFSIDCGLW